VLKASQRQAVRRHLTPRIEAQRELADQLPLLNSWLDFAGPRAANPQARIPGAGVAFAHGASIFSCHL
jgi:hypothetical protein